MDIKKSKHRKKFKHRNFSDTKESRIKMPSTHNNPYGQGGWSNENQNHPGAVSPASSDRTAVSSDGTVVSTGGIAQPGYIPPQSSYGALPVPQAPGSVTSTVTTESYVPFRFSARNSTDFFVLAPHERAAYRVTSSGQSSIMTDPTGRQIARIDWHATPAIQLHGRQLTAPQFLQPVSGRGGFVMNIRGAQYFWTYDSRNFNLVGSGGVPRVAMATNTAAGIEIRLLRAMADPQTLENIIVAILVLQGRQIVGL